MTRADGSGMKHETIKPNLVVSIDALAERLGVSRAWLRREVRWGRVPYLRAGNRRLFNVEAVRAELEARAAGGGEVSPQ